MEGYERDQYLMEDYEKDHIEGSESEVQADADAREDKIDKLKKIIKEAWNEGNLYVEAGLDRKDTFGDFLDRAAKAIQDAGYQRIETLGEVFARAKKRPDLVFPPEQTYTLNCDHCGKPFDTPVAFPSPQLCPRCSEPKVEGRLLADKNTVVLCQEFLCEIFNRISTFLETVKALKKREEK